MYHKITLLISICCVESEHGSGYDDGSEVGICSIACGPFGELADFVELNKVSKKFPKMDFAKM